MIVNLPKIVSLAEHEVCFVVEFGPDLPEAAVAAAALEAVLVPEPFHGFEEKPLCDHLPALGTQPGATGVPRHTRT